VSAGRLQLVEHTWGRVLIRVHKSNCFVVCPVLMPCNLLASANVAALARQLVSTFVFTCCTCLWVHMCALFCVHVRPCVHSDVLGAGGVICHSDSCDQHAPGRRIHCSPAAGVEPVGVPVPPRSFSGTRRSVRRVGRGVGTPPSCVVRACFPFVARVCGVGTSRVGGHASRQLGVWPRAPI
jgi:hypothetical protein